MPLVRPASMPLIQAWQTDTPTVSGADAAAQTLRGDFERWARFGWGVLAYLGSVFGLFGIGAALDVLTAYHATGTEAVLAISVGVVALALTLPGLVALHRLWRTGRQLSRAAAWWMRLPYRLGGRQRPASGWFAPRAARYEPAILARITTCALTFLAAAFGLSAAAFPDRGDMPVLTATFVAVGVLSLLCLLGQMGGVLNIISGLSEQDPLWVRIRDSFRKG